MSRYSPNRHDRKLAGVASTLGDVFNIDPTFIRIGFVAAALLISWKLALVAYVAAGIYLSLKKHKALRGEERKSGYERMADVGRTRSSMPASACRPTRSPTSTGGPSGATARVATWAWGRSPNGSKSVAANR